MQGMGVGAGIGAAAFWIFIAAIVVAGIWYSVREREAKQETLRRLIESGQPVDEAVMEKLVGGGKRLDRDLRISGLILAFTAPGFAVLGWFISLGAPEALLPMLGVAVLIGFIAAGLLVAARSVERSYAEERRAATDRPAD